MTLRLAALYLAAAVVWAQAPERETAAVTGRVVSAADGSPLAGALVVLGGAATEKTWTGADGRFRLAADSQRTYLLVTAKAGFHTNEGRVVVDGTVQAEAAIRLIPASVIAGTAIGPAGEPLDDAVVTLWAQSERLGDIPTLSRRMNTRVDDRGQFRLPGVRAGNYLLTLEPTAAPAPDGVERLTAAPSLYPEPSGAGSFATLRVRPGERVENVDFRTAAGRTALAGRVTECSGCRVGVYRRSGEFFAPVHEMGTTGDGSFLLEGLAPGAYVLAANSGRRNGDGLIGLAEVTLAAGQTSHAQVFLTEGAQMTVTKSHLNPPEQGHDTPQRGAGPFAVVFDYLGPQLAGGIQRGDGFSRGPRGDSEHQIGLAPGPYALRVRGIPSGGYLTSVLVDGRPPLNGRFVLGDGSEHQTEIVVAYDSGTVEGMVTASHDVPLKDAQIYLLPQNPVLPNDLSQTSADDAGAFSVQVGPGRYEVYALPRDADWNLADPVDRQRLAGYRGGVEVRPGQTAAVKVRLAPIWAW